MDLVATTCAEQKTVPNWNAVNEMVEESIPETAFKHSIDMEFKQPVEFFINTAYKQFDLTYTNIVCPLNTNNKKKISKRMNSYMPQNVAMKVPFNKKLAAYVDHYLRRLTAAAPCFIQVTSRITQRLLISGVLIYGN
ncbi:hypothetical protein OB236_40010 [Paenibacillus sp. WQ 127069]|uniref:Uncharacterized protein n=1 Tax=Paenibacillus baimaensis TaxID=2982185 RepID=A0ABT2UUJ7_9BACL|nr:hypothetical protein [Paenibacillus sp. WQ 127069]